jgi:hypothetical protein
VKTQKTKTSAFFKVTGPALFLIPFMMWHGASFGQELDGESVGTLSLSASTLNLSRQNSGWSASLLYSSVAYSEPGLMTETGSLSGMALSYTYAFHENPVVLQVEGEYLYGQLTYVGSTWEGQPLTTSAEDNMLNGRALLGLQMQATNRLNIMPFLGIAARYLNDQIQGGYDREITYFYAPIGANFTLGLVTHWALSLGGEYDHFISGNVVSHINQSDSAYPAVDNTQSNGYGYRLTAGIEHSFASGWSLKISPYLCYWKVQQSDSQTFVANNSTLSVYEPNNTSIMYGVKVSFVF